MRNLYIFILLCLVIPGLSGCARIELASHFGKKLAGSSVPSKGYYKVGSPYVINGKRYYPSVDYGYNKTGIASWYGPNFHGKSTANGEIFDQNELTAAHKTLPLPSIVRVTNLENGKSIVARVNDRGPYAHGRIIDMSKRSAELLGFKNQGTAKVRVQVLEPESRMVAKVAQNGQDTGGMEVAMNRPNYKSPSPAAYQKTVSPQVKPARYQTASLQTDKPRVIPGHKKSGQFYPDPMIAEQAVKPTQIYVQMASFSTRESAMKFSSVLREQGYAPALIQPANVNGENYYRVRFRAETIANADELLDRVLRDGHSRAIIIVD
ncbi:MAG: septal ring lytic transglycosylase RlpA family protein [Alphaproteobacteria bacterium]|nr:septal ring lytic transglycosylase RlpA family protein [Alphaproteobacteria bacterium]